MRWQEGAWRRLENGFSLYDGAVQALGKFEEEYSVYIDIPLRWVGAQDTDGDGVQDEFANRWGVAQSRAQIYLARQREKYRILIG